MGLGLRFGVRCYSVSTFKNYDITILWLVTFDVDPGPASRNNFNTTIRLLKPVYWTLCISVFLEQALKAQISLFNPPHCFMFVSFKSLSEICVLSHMCQSVHLHNTEEVFSWGFFFTLELRRGITNSSELFGWHMHSNQTWILLLVCVSTLYWWCHVGLWF